VTLTSRPTVQVVDDFTGARPDGGVSPLPQPTPHANIWTIPASSIKTSPTPYLRLRFIPEEISLSTPLGNMSLAKWIDMSGLRYVGWDGKTIVSFIRIGTSVVGE
jgi:hypothetical protein